MLYPPKRTNTIFPPIHSYRPQPSPQSITPPIPPPTPPPLLPPPALKLPLPQLPIDLVMRLAHPPAQRLPPLHPRPVAPRPHPRLEILRARPARVQARKEGQELLHLGLLGGGCGGRVGGREGVEEGPGGAAEGFDVGGAVGGGVVGGGGGGGGGWGRGQGLGCGVFFDHGAPGGDGGAGAAALRWGWSLAWRDTGRGEEGEGVRTHGLPSLPSTTPLGMSFFSGGAASLDSAVGFLAGFWTSLKNLSMVYVAARRRGKGEGNELFTQPSPPVESRRLASAAEKNDAMPAMPWPSVSPTSSQVLPSTSYLCANVFHPRSLQPTNPNPPPQNTLPHPHLRRLHPPPNPPILPILRPRPIPHPPPGPPHQTPPPTLHPQPLPGPPTRPSTLPVRRSNIHIAARRRRVRVRAECAAGGEDLGEGGGGVGKERGAVVCCGTGDGEGAEGGAG